MEHIPDKLKERFNLIGSKHMGFFDSLAPEQNRLVLHLMHQAYQLAEGESKWIDAKKKLPEVPEKQYRIAMRNKNKPDGMIICDTAVFNSDGNWIRFDSWEDVLYWRPFNDTPPTPKD